MNKVLTCLKTVEKYLSFILLTALTVSLLLVGVTFSTVGSFSRKGVDLLKARITGKEEESKSWIRTHPLSILLSTVKIGWPSKSKKCSDNFEESPLFELDSFTRLGEGDEESSQTYKESEPHFFEEEGDNNIQIDDTVEVIAGEVNVNGHGEK